MASTENGTRYTGDLAAWLGLEASFDARLADASPDAHAIALAVRAGLAEIAVDVSRIRAFGTGPRKAKAVRKGRSS